MGLEKPSMFKTFGIWSRVVCENAAFWTQMRDADRCREERFTCLRERLSVVSQCRYICEHSWWYLFLRQVAQLNNAMERLDEIKSPNKSSTFSTHLGSFPDPLGSFPIPAKAKLNTPPFHISDSFHLSFLLLQSLVVQIL